MFSADFGRLWRITILKAFPNSLNVGETDLRRGELPDPEEQLRMPIRVVESTCCAVLVRIGLCVSCQARSG